MNNINNIDILLEVYLWPHKTQATAETCEQLYEYIFLFKTYRPVFSRVDNPAAYNGCMNTAHFYATLIATSAFYGILGFIDS